MMGGLVKGLYWSRAKLDELRAEVESQSPTATGEEEHGSKSRLERSVDGDAQIKAA
jgi:hypothetical protein